MRNTRELVGRAVVATAVAVAVLASGASGASAAPPWLAPVDASAPGTTSVAPDVAVARDGTTIAVFGRAEGGSTQAYAVVRPPGGSFGPPTPLSAAGAEATDLGVAVDRQGGATAVWRRGGLVQSTYRPAGGAWQTPQTLSAAAAGTPTIAAGDSGAAAVVFTVASTVQVAVRQGGSASFGLPATSVAGPGTIRGTPKVAMDAAGDLTVLWNREYDVGGGTLRRVMESVAKPSSGPFEPVRTLSSTTAGGAGYTTTVVILGSPIVFTTAVYDLAMSSDGRSFAIWDYDTDSADMSNPQRVEYSERTPTGGWAFRKTLSAPAVSADEPKAAADDVGGVVAVWDGDNTVVSAVRPDLASAFSAPKALSGAGASSISSTVAAAPNGEALVTWPATPAGDPTIVAARRRAGTSEFGENVEVVRGKGGTATPAAPNTSYSSLRLALDDQGNGAAALLRFRSDGSTVTYTPQVVSFDPVAPTLGAVAVPGTATAGAPVAFSASPADRIGPTAVTWDFGDAQSGAGDAVGHTYGAAGTYAVKVVATDATGNRTELTRSIQVAAAAAPAPGGGEVPGPGPGAPGTDADGDGTLAGADCDDRDARIRPGAKEVPGNAVDEDCDGRATPFPPVGSRVSLSVSRLKSGRTRIRALTVRGLAKGDVVTVTCATRARGCRKAASRRTTVRRGTSLSLTRAVKGMTLAPKATLTIRVTRKNATTRIDTYTMARKKAPVRVRRCQAPGASRIGAC